MESAKKRKKVNKRDKIGKKEKKKSQSLYGYKQNYPRGRHTQSIWKRSKNTSSRLPISLSLSHQSRTNTGIKEENNFIVGTARRASTKNSAGDVHKTPLKPSKKSYSSIISHLPFLFLLLRKKNLIINTHLQCSLSEKRRGHHHRVKSLLIPPQFSLSQKQNAFLFLQSTKVGPLSESSVTVRRKKDRHRGRHLPLLLPPFLKHPTI